MKTNNYTVSDTTSKFIQALQTIMIAENQLSEGFNMRYGEESSMIDKSGLPELIEALKDRRLYGDHNGRELAPRG